MPLSGHQGLDLVAGGGDPDAQAADDVIVSLKALPGGLACANESGVAFVQALDGVVEVPQVLVGLGEAPVVVGVNVPFQQAAQALDPFAKLS